MKKIFVTVAEFLENGGELKEGLRIYPWYNRQHRVADWGQVYTTDPKTYSPKYKSVCLTKSDYSVWFVEIDCQPIYV